MTTDNCPKCERSLDDGKGYRLETGIEYRRVYDGVAFWADDPHNGGCGWAWHRFTGDDDFSVSKRKQIQPYLNNYISLHFG